MVSERLDQLDLTRQVIGVIRADLAQFLDQLGRDAFRLMVPAPPMNDTMPDGCDFREPDRVFEPIDQQADGRLLVRGIDRAIFLATAAGIGDDPPGILQPDPIDVAGQDPRGRIGPLKERELEARRSTVDRQDAVRSRATGPVGNSSRNQPGSQTHECSIGS